MMLLVQGRYIHNRPRKPISLGVVRVKVALLAGGLSMLLVIISVGILVRAFVARAFVVRAFVGRSFVGRNFVVRRIFFRALRTASYHLVCLVENSLPFRKYIVVACFLVFGVSLLRLLIKRIRITERVASL
jgi:hypothetical protein